MSKFIYCLTYILLKASITSTFHYSTLKVKSVNQEYNEMLQKVKFSIYLLNHHQNINKILVYKNAIFHAIGSTHCNVGKYITKLPNPLT